MTARRGSAGLAAALMLAACGARSGVYLGDGSGAATGLGGASGAGAPNAGAPGRAGAPQVSGGAPSGGSPSAGAPGAGAGGASLSCVDDSENCPNGFACIAGRCLTHCDSAADCRFDRFCASGTVCSLRATQIAAGQSDTCVVLVDGTLRCWGDGDAGQLGDGLSRTSADPVRTKALVGGETGIEQMVLGTSYACAVTDNGVGNCWGAGDLGQLGNDTFDSSIVPTPVAFSELGYVLIGAGRYHACGLLRTGEVRCWGANFDGQLGNGTTANSLIPVPIAAMVDPTTKLVRCGDEHTCILVGDPMPGTQSVRCWGDNSEDQLGFDGPTNKIVPFDVPGVTIPNADITDLVTGAYHTCAAYSDGSARCWGDNSQGQLGVAQPSLSPHPVRVQGIPPNLLVREISAGEHHTCALMNDRTVLCWGNGAASGLSVATTAPVRILGLSEDNAPVAIAAGATHTCALMMDGSARCWGSNNDSALGVPDIEYSASAVVVRPW